MFLAEVAIELIFVAAVVVAVSSLAYLLTLTVKEQRILRDMRAGMVAGQSTPAPAEAAPKLANVRSLRPSVTRQHAVSSR
jgi:hypothetical protein